MNVQKLGNDRLLMQSNHLYRIIAQDRNRRLPIVNSKLRAQSNVRFGICAFVDGPVQNRRGFHCQYNAASQDCNCNNMNPNRIFEHHTENIFRRVHSS